MKMRNMLYFLSELHYVVSKQHSHIPVIPYSVVKYTIL